MGMDEEMPNVSCTPPSVTQSLAESLFIRAVKGCAARGYRLPRQMAVVRTVAKLHQAA